MVETVGDVQKDFHFVYKSTSEEDALNNNNNIIAKEDEEKAGTGFRFPLKKNTKESLKAAADKATALKHDEVYKNPVPKYHDFGNDNLRLVKGENKIRVFITCWNLHGSKPPENLSHWIHHTDTNRHHLYVIGTSECNSTIKQSVVTGPNKKSNTELDTNIGDYLGHEYSKVGSTSLGAMHLVLFAHQSVLAFIWDVSVQTISTGFGNVVNNKGCCLLGMCIAGRSLLFYNNHLTPHAKKMKQRTANFLRIMKNTRIRPFFLHADKAKRKQYAHLCYDHVFYFGDLNWRINAPRAKVDEKIAICDHIGLLKMDQLLPLLRRKKMKMGDVVEQAANAEKLTEGSSEDDDLFDDDEDLDQEEKPSKMSKCFEGRNKKATAKIAPASDAASPTAVPEDNAPARAAEVIEEDAGAIKWNFFKEQKIEFAPTYRFDAGTSVYDTSKKQRVPSWTDRILYKATPDLKACSYDAAINLQAPETMVSDHRAVFAQFEIGGVVIDERMKRQVQEWKEEREEATGCFGGHLHWHHHG